MDAQSGPFPDQFKNPGTGDFRFESEAAEQYARTRTFYVRQGFAEEARIRRFYGPDDHKVVFWKSLTDD